MDTINEKVVFISGVARGQGRSHAVRFAREGAKVIGFDICRQIDTVPFAMATSADLAETERQVRAAGGEIVATQADVRDPHQVEEALAVGVAEFGRVDIVLANAGIGQPYESSWAISEEAFRNVIDVNLVGAWHTAKAAVAQMAERGHEGSVMFTGSGASVKGLRNMAGYVAAKHGLIGLMRTMAHELAPYRIRVNAVLPGNTNTPMFHNDGLRRLFVPDVEHPTEAQFLARAAAHVPMQIPHVEAADVTDAVMWLCSSAARHVTGIEVPVDGGGLLR